MDVYGWVIFFHVLGAIVWLGTTFSVGILVWWLSQQRNQAGLGAILSAMTVVGPRVIGPAAGVALLSGLIGAWMGGWFATLWAWIGLAGFAATFVLGNLLTRPRVAAAVPLLASEGFSPKTIALNQELRALGWFDYVLMTVIVADMVLKPSVTDWLTLLLMVIALGAGAFFFIVPVVQKQLAAAS